MKKGFLLQFIMLLIAFVGSVGTVKAADTWVETAASGLKTGDVVVIVDKTSGRAMTNNNGTTGAPGAVAVDLSEEKDEITSEVADNLQWEVTVDNGKYQFKTGDDYLYCTNTNNGVRVGSNNNNVFTIENVENDFLFNVGTSRYLGVYNNQDWRCYSSVGTNIQNCVVAFYVKSSGLKTPRFKISNEVIVKGYDAKITTTSPVAFSCSSSSESVATVNADGVVTGVAEGEAVITVTWDGIEGEYAEGSTEIAVKVIKGSVYEKVTSADQLFAGHEYILVAEKSSVAMGKNNGKNRGYVSVEISHDQVVIGEEDEEAVAVLTLGGKSGAWTFKASDDNMYLALTTSSNELHASIDNTVNTSTWTISDDYQLVPNKFDTRAIKYNSGSPRFACYASSQVEAYLYVKIKKSVSVSVGETGFATLASDIALDFTNSEIKAYKASVSGENITLTKVDKVAAGEGVLVYYADGAKTEDIPAATETVEASADNAFVGALEEIASLPTEGESGKNYILSIVNGKVGFYQAAGKKVAAGKAYLSVPATGAKEFYMVNMENAVVTGINEVNTEKADNAIYNLNGVRVKDMSQKGVYIVNGKKVVKK